MVSDHKKYKKLKEQVHEQGSEIQEMKEEQRCLKLDVLKRQDEERLKDHRIQKILDGIDVAGKVKDCEYMTKDEYKKLSLISILIRVVITIVIIFLSACIGIKFEFEYISLIFDIFS